MLFHSLHVSLERNDVVLADCFSCFSWEVVLVLGRGIDSARRWHQRRQVGFRGGRRVGLEDQVVAWSKPKQPR